MILQDQANLVGTGGKDLEKRSGEMSSLNKLLINNIVSEDQK